MATLPFVELPHLALVAAAIVAMSGCAVSVDLGDADERVEIDRYGAAGPDIDVRTDPGSAHGVTVATDNADIHIAER